MAERLSKFNPEPNIQSLSGYSHPRSQTNSLTDYSLSESDTEAPSIDVPRLARFLVPGIFLLLLGLGNIGVGTYKGAEYEQVLEELSEIDSSSHLINASALKRIQLAKTNTHRSEQLRQKASARRDFYNLVVFGGKFMLSISTIVLLMAAVVAFYRNRALED